MILHNNQIIIRHYLISFIHFDIILILYQIIQTIDIIIIPVLYQSMMYSVIIWKYDYIKILTQNLLKMFLIFTVFTQNTKIYLHSITTSFNIYYLSYLLQCELLMTTFNLGLQNELWHMWRSLGWLNGLSNCQLYYIKVAKFSLWCLIALNYPALMTSRHLDNFNI